MLHADPGTLLKDIVDAINAHDLDALVDRFAVGVVSETPAHPARGFVGRQQVLRNWTRIFGAVHDIHATIFRSAVNGADVWGELEFSGHLADGSRHLMRGVTIQTVVDGTVSHVRFYMEPVDDAPVGPSVAVDRLVGEGAMRAQPAMEALGPAGATRTTRG